MAKREVLGRLACPECGFPDAEVKPQKSGLAYRWCPECNAQYFTRCETTSARLLAKVGAGVTAAGPVTVTDTQPGEGARQAGTVPPAAAAPEAAALPPKKKGSGNALLDLINGV